VRRLLGVIALLLVVCTAAAPAASAEEGKVRAILFFSPTCGHCEYVINDWLLPVWFPQYGGDPEWYSGAYEGENPAFLLATNGTLEILLVNTATQAGSQLFVASAEAFGLASRGVPFLVYQDRYLIGSGEIPEQFPGVIEEGLDSGGIDWPDLPGMQEVLAAISVDPTTTTTTPGETTTTAPHEDTTSTTPATTTTSAAVTTTTEGVLPIGGDSVWDRFQQDKVANSLALVVLALMVLSLGGVVWLIRRGDDPGSPGIAVPLLALVGLIVAAYLAFVETSGSQAVCGPVGDCNTVQQSEWAKVLGIHIGVIGVAGYAVALGTWVMARFARGPLADWARLALFAGAAAGTGFSIYLTFLEPFVIGATCLWCLSSAVIVTALMWLTARPGTAAWSRLRAGD
jgi:uncharacterized membrane protein